MLGENGKISFSPTQAIALPPEAWYLVHENLGKAELRVTLCILFNHFEVGTEATPLTFSEIVEQTGMSKSSVLEGLNAAIGRGSVFRKNLHNQTRYEPRFGKTEPMTCINHDNHGLTRNITHENQDSCHEFGKTEPEQILKCLVRFGLAYHVAFNIAMTNRYPLEDLQNQLLYIFHEIRKGAAPHGRAFCGYVVNRIKFNRFAPKDFDRPMAQVQRVMAETGKSRDEVFQIYHDGDDLDQMIQDLEFHQDYLLWVSTHTALQEEYHETR